MNSNGMRLLYTAGNEIRRKYVSVTYVKRHLVCVEKPEEKGNICHMHSSTADQVNQAEKV